MWGPAIDGAWRPPVDTDVRFHTITIGSERGRLLSERVEHDGFRYVAAVVAPLADFERDMGQLRRSLMLGIVSALVLAAIAGLVVGRRALRPLAEMAEQARTITEANPVERLRAPNPRDELGTFASSFNGLLDRLASVLQAQRQFMADASHELRTPVSIVRSAAQVTLARPLRSDGEYRESLTIVAEQAERLTRLVDAMFLLSRAEANGLPLMREAVYLDDLVTETVRALRVVAQERGVSIDMTGDEELLFVGDDRLLRQLLTNVIGNAIHHARRSVAVTCQRTDDTLTVRVADDGQGIAAADRARIFDRFVRLSSTLRRRRSRIADRQVDRRSARRERDARIERAHGLGVRDRSAGCFASGRPPGRRRERDGRDGARRDASRVWRAPSSHATTGERLKIASVIAYDFKLPAVLRAALAAESAGSGGIRIRKDGFHARYDHAANR